MVQRIVVGGLEGGDNVIGGQLLTVGEVDVVPQGKLPVQIVNLLPLGGQRGLRGLGLIIPANQGIEQAAVHSVAGLIRDIVGENGGGFAVTGDLQGFFRSALRRDKVGIIYGLVGVGARVIGGAGGVRRLLAAGTSG